MKSFFVLTFVAAAWTATADAQYSGLPRNVQPAYWVSGGVGAFNGQGVQDGKTQSTWDFGQKTSWRYSASIEKAIQNESTIGIVGTYVKVPFTYFGPPTAQPGIAGASCAQCSAHLDMYGLAAQFHAGGGVGFHQVLDVALGATEYRNLKRDLDGAGLAPAGGNIDGSFSVGYGFGYGLSSNSEVTLIQDYGLVLHENSGLTSGASNTNTVRSIRMALRYGFGAQHPGVRRR